MEVQKEKIGDYTYIFYIHPSVCTLSVHRTYKTKKKEASVGYYKLDNIKELRKFIEKLILDFNN